LSILIFFNKAIQKSDCCWVLAQACTSPHAKQIRDLNELQ